MLSSWLHQRALPGSGLYLGVSRAWPIAFVETPRELTMVEISVHTELLHGVTTGPLGGWSLPGGALVVGGVLAAVLIGAAFATTRSALTGETVTPELPIAAIIGTSAPRSVRVAAAAPTAAAQPSFAFGFLEFDWDPNAPGGVPGYVSWPKHDLRVAGVSPRH